MLCVKKYKMTDVWAEYANADIADRGAGVGNCLNA